MPELYTIPSDGYADGGEPYTDDELEIINSDGDKLDKQEADKLLKEIQAGVFYIPQRR